MAPMHCQNLTDVQGFAPPLNLPLACSKFSDESGQDATYWTSGKLFNSVSFRICSLGYIGLIIISHSDVHLEYCAKAVKENDV